MKVHIVCDNPSSDKILARLACVLAANTGWTIGKFPDQNVDVNYWDCYINYAEKYCGYKKTKTAAFFTHYDTVLPEKEDWWTAAARAIDLRITSAPQYAGVLSALGKTAIARPALDRAAFGIETRPPTAPPTVGLSGFVAKLTYHRKGADLVERLAQSDFAHKLRLVATGMGWPHVKTVERAIGELPHFYHSLDVLLCASRVEGIPMPPLEALACGVPVVIPRGVGLLDELPDIAGVWRFDPGDYDGMLDALDNALANIGNANRSELRAATEPYTAENYVDDMTRAFESILFSTTRPEKCARTDGGEGVIYVAYGKPSRECAVKAITSFKAHMPGIPVALLSDSPLGPEDIFIQHPDTDIGGRGVKTSIYDLAPADWKRVLYLDADTEVIADIGFLFQVLCDGWDFVICKNPGKFHVVRQMIRPDNKDECEETFKLLGSDELIQFNGGVWAFSRNERTAALMRGWHDEWNRYGKRDQAALLRALWAHPVRLYTLGNEWNLVENYDSRDKCAGIMHYPMTARRHVGIVSGRLDSDEAWGKVRGK